MKKSHLLLMASGLILASCAEDLTPQPEYGKTPEGNVPMSFNFRSGNMTREDAQLETIHKDFGVWAYKSDQTMAASMVAEGNTVMENYLVGHSSKWPIAAGLADDTHSDWWYENLGNTQYPNSISNNLVQFLKYWDLGKKYTSFFAYAPYLKGTDNTPVLAVDDTNDKATLTFKQTLTMGVENDLMFAGRIEENAEHASSAKVPLQFNRLTSKIQLAIYEAIPGWHVEMVNAEYIIADGGTEIDRTNRNIVAMPVEVAGDNYTRGSLVFSGKPVVEFDLTPADVEKGSFNANNTTKNLVSVSYTNVERHGDEPHAFLEFALPSTNLTKRVATDDNIYLSENRLTPSYSSTVYDVIPNNGNLDIADKENSGIQLIMNFRLVADDTAEVIEVKNARAYVPKTACQWAPNTLYTYIFKITKDVSGTTENKTPVIDPEKPGKALYPIIFDDVTIKEMDEITYAGTDNTGYPVN